MSTPKQTDQSHSLCWNCHSELESPYKCVRCVKIQPWADDTDYFQFLGLPRRLQIDLDDLEARFLKLSRIFHPDFFQESEFAEQDIALVNAARLNKAYATLKDRETRAGYILELELGEKYRPTKNVPPELATSIFEVQELMAELSTHSGNAAEQETIKALKARKEELHKDSHARLEELDVHFAAYDKVIGAATSPFEPSVRRKIEEILRAMDQTLAARLYLKRIIQNITATLEGNSTNGH